MHLIRRVNGLRWDVCVAFEAPFNFVDDGHKNSVQVGVLFQLELLQDPSVYPLKEDFVHRRLA